MVVTTEGRQNIADLAVAGVSGSEYDAIAIGSDGTAATESDTSLGTEVDRATGLTGSASSQQFTIETTFTGLSANIQEAGLFNDTSGNMLVRDTFSEIPLSSNDELTVTFTVSIN